MRDQERWLSVLDRFDAVQDWLVGAIVGVWVVRLLVNVASVVVGRER